MITERGYIVFQAERLYVREVYEKAGMDKRERDPASKSRKDLISNQYRKTRSRVIKIYIFPPKDLFSPANKQPFSLIKIPTFYTPQLYTMGCLFYS